MKAAKTLKVRASKTNYMNKEAFADLKEELEDALAFERGERRMLKVTRIQPPPNSEEIVTLGECWNS